MLKHTLVHDCLVGQRKSYELSTLGTIVELFYSIKKKKHAWTAKMGTDGDN